MPGIQGLTINSLTVHHRRIALVRPFVTAVRSATAIDVVLVQARDSDGRSGWGEAPTSWRVTGESRQSVTAAVEGPLTEAVLGAPVDDPAGTSALLARSLVRNSAARMAVDCALYDLAAQAAGIPLYRYLGADHGTVRTDMTLSAGLRGENEDGLIATAIEHRDAGFGTLKVKVGAGGDDVSVLRRVRTEVGAGIGLRVDANQGWTAEQAVSVISAWEDAGLGIEMVEQPVAMDDLDALEFVTRHVNTPILADEAVWTTRDLTEVIRRHAADLVNIKLAKTGGLREALRMAELARHNDVAVIIGCMMESHVGISAAASLACALEATGAATRSTAHDLDAGLWLKQSPVTGGAAYERDVVRLPAAAGLGISGLAAD
ncbi:MAG: dipeptide epimerase [Phycicoccus sp.]|nr:dipeptide epimerase [Phycicoccus sp.]NMM32863.1 dipeptide epimerase [Phycicoccus sp.]